MGDAGKRPVDVGVVMGSDSDLATMQKCIDQLKEFGIAHEVRIMSAHRTPDVCAEYAASASRRGLKVIIAAAGMAAALPGVMAAKTTLPVIGVPMASPPLNGIDAALCIMQMPPGVPVGCVAIGPAGATNAAILAAQILALSDEALARTLAEFKDKQARGVIAKDASLQEKLNA